MEIVYLNEGSTCESVCVHGGRIFTERQYMYREAVCVDGGKVLYRFTDTHLPDYTVSKVRSAQCEPQSS